MFKQLLGYIVICLIESVRHIIPTLESEGSSACFSIIIIKRKKEDYAVITSGARVFSP